MTNKPVKLKNRSGDYLYPYTENIPTASTSTAGKVKLDNSPTSGSNNAITSGAVHSALAAKLDANGTAAKATADAEGNNIASTYSKQSDVQSMLALIYPVGSIYIGTQDTCPMTALIPNSTWDIVSEDRALWGGNGANGNTTIEAGLPNITGSFSNTPSTTNAYSGAFRRGGDGQTFGNGNDRRGSDTTFNASLSNSIYGASTTVQPPAYVVNVWRRTA